MNQLYMYVDIGVEQECGWIATLYVLIVNLQLQYVYTLFISHVMLSHIGSSHGMLGTIIL